MRIRGHLSVPTRPVITSLALSVSPHRCQEVTLLCPYTHETQAELLGCGVLNSLSLVTSRSVRLSFHTPGLGSLVSVC